MRRGSTSVTTLTVPESEVQLRWVTADGREDSQPEYDDCAVRCTAQEDGKLAFACDVVPAENVVANVAIFV